MPRLWVIRWQSALCCWGLVACVLTGPAFAQEAVQFVTMRLRQQLRHQVRIVE
jgi:hypothetical protein